MCVPSGSLLEQKSLGDFLSGFRGREIFQGEAVNAILDDVVTSCDPSVCEVEGIFNARGGMGTRAVARQGDGPPPLQASLRRADQAARSRFGVSSLPRRDAPDSVLDPFAGREVVIGRMDARSLACECGSAASLLGSMFWFRRNRLSGSYLSSSATSRSDFSAP